MPGFRYNTTKKLSRDFQIRFEIPSFKRDVLDLKEVKQSSPICNETDLGRFFWMLYVFARNGKDGSSSNDHCYAKLRLINTQPTYLKSLPVTYRFGLLNVNGGIDFKTDTFKSKSTDIITISGNDVEFFSRSKLMANKNQVIVDGAVIVTCQISVGVDDDAEVSNKVSYRELMLQEAILTDITVVTSDHKTIKAHKAMLARSPVFRAMFINEMKEKLNGEVDVKNFNHAVIQELINFIYTDKVQDLESIAGDLLLAADFYDLPELKEICIKSLEGNVTFANFSHSIIIAEHLQIISIREAVLKFVVENRKTITSCSGWQELKSHSDLYDHVIAAVFDNTF